MSEKMKGNKNAERENPKSSFLHIRCTPQEKGMWKQAAYPDKLAQWVTDTLNKEAMKRGQ